MTRKSLFAWLLLLLWIIGPIMAQQPDDDELNISDFDPKPASKPVPQPAVKTAPAQPVVKSQPTVTQPETTPTDKSQPQPVETKKPAPEPRATEEAMAESGAAPLRFNEDRTTRYVTLGGHLNIGFIFRDDFFADAILGNTTTDFDEDFFDPRITLNLTIQLENNIRGVIELHNEERDARLHRTSLGTHYITSRTNDNQFRFQIEKAYVEISNFLTQGLTFKGGVIPFKRALRADGQAFFIDLGEAESPFDSRPDTNAAGVLATWQPIRQMQFYGDFFYFVTAESNFKRADETVAGISLDLDLTKELRGDDESRIELPRFFNLIFATIQNDNRAPIWSFGAGFSYFTSGDPQTYLIEFYGEALFQFGKYRDKTLVGSGEQNQLAFGGYSGLRYSYRQGLWKPFLDASAWYISGDDGDPQAKTNRDLVTYENMDSTVIVEDNDYGLDVDSNYWAIKIQGGINLNAIVNEEVRLTLLYAHFTTVDAPQHRSRRLGEEIDVRLTWEYSPDLTFSLVNGVLWNSRHFRDVFDEVGARGKEHAFLLRAETSLRF